MGWKDTIQKESEKAAPSWRDTAVDDIPKEGPSALGADLRGIVSGATAGFDDEIQGGIGAAGRVAGVTNLGSWKPFDSSSHLEYDSPTLDRSDLVKAYIANRDAARFDKAKDETQFPGRSMVANAAGAVVSPAARLGLLGGGAAFGLGNSNADLTEGDVEGAAKDTAKGAVVAKVAGEAIPLAAKGVMKAAEATPKVLGKLGRIFSGADSDALARQVSRPSESAAAEAEGFASETAGEVMDAIAAKGRQAGVGVGEAEKRLIKGVGVKPFEEAKQLGEKIEQFLSENKPSPQGFSAISPSQVEELNTMKQSLQSGTPTGEDLVKFRKHLDHVENLASQYDKTSSSPFVRFLKSVRHDADAVLDKADPRYDAANQAFSQYKSDSSLLRGATRDATAESFVNNLYSGANKKASQASAERLLEGKPELLDKMRDIAANKSIAKIGPSGSEQGLRNILKVGGGIGAHTAGIPFPAIVAGEAFLSPAAWKFGLRGLGRVGEALGPYGPILEKASARGEGALAATHSILLKDPDYQERIQAIGRMPAGGR